MNRHAAIAPTWRASLGGDPLASRTSTAPTLVPRADPVVYPGRAGPLAPEQLQAFEADGYLVLPGCIPAEQARAALEETRRATATGAVPVQLEPGGVGVRSAYRVHRAGPTLAALAADPALVGAAEQILGSDAYLLQSRVDFRSLEGSEFYWRSDFEIWHVEDGMPRMRALTARVLLTPSDDGDGPLLVIPGSHRTFAPCVDPAHAAPSGAGRRSGTGIPRLTLQWLIDDQGITAIRGEPGTVVLLDGNLLHADPATLSPHPSATLSLALNSVENRLVAPFGGRPPRPEHLAERG